MPTRRKTIHIVDGVFVMEIDGARTELSTGQTIHVPRGVLHSGANIGRQPGRRMVIFSPAGMQEFFLEAGAPTAHTEPDLAAALAAAIRHGWEFITRS